QLFDGRWHHVAVTSQGVSKKFYLDGNQMTTVNGSNFFTGSVTGSTLYGRIGGPSYLTTYPSNSKLTKGELDEVGIWNRVLHPTEINQLFRRGSNRTKFQVRNCTTVNCNDDLSGTNWKGPDGTNLTYFSENDNRQTQGYPAVGAVKPNLPVINFASYANPVSTSRYFQYRLILETDDTSSSCNYGSGNTWCSPEIKKVELAPNHVDKNSPTISTLVGTSYITLNSFTETLGANGCTGATYNVSKNTSNWYYWTGSAWAVSDGTASQSNSASTVSSQLSTLPGAIGMGTLYIKTFLNSNGEQGCEIDKLSASGTN
ncbi:MAG: hypothetical protein EOO68_34345, partial [Moraxellaceae bacterium]